MKESNNGLTKLEIRKFKQNPSLFLEHPKVKDFIRKSTYNIKYDHTTLLRLLEIDAEDYSIMLQSRIFNRVSKILEANNVWAVLQYQHFQLRAALASNVNKRVYKTIPIHYSNSEALEFIVENIKDKGLSEDDLILNKIEQIEDIPIICDGKDLEFYSIDGDKITYKKFAKSIFEYQKASSIKKQWYKKSKEITTLSFNKAFDSLKNYVEEKGLTFSME